MYETGKRDLPTTALTKLAEIVIFFEQKHKVSKEKELQTVVLLITKDIIPYFGDQKYYNGFVKEEVIGEYMRMTFLCGSLMGFSRWFMLFGDKAKIVEPLELNDMISEIAEKILKKIEENQMLLT